MAEQRERQRRCLLYDLGLLSCQYHGALNLLAINDTVLSGYRLFVAMIGKFCVVEIVAEESQDQRVFMWGFSILSHS